MIEHPFPSGVDAVSSARGDSNSRYPVPKTGAIAARRLAGFIFLLLPGVSTGLPTSSPAMGVRLGKRQPTERQ